MTLTPIKITWVDRYHIRPLSVAFASVINIAFVAYHLIANDTLYTVNVVVGIVCAITAGFLAIQERESLRAAREYNEMLERFNQAFPS